MAGPLFHGEHGAQGQAKCDLCDWRSSLLYQCSERRRKWAYEWGFATMAALRVWIFGFIPVIRGDCVERVWLYMYLYEYIQLIYPYIHYKPIPLSWRNACKTNPFNPWCARTTLSSQKNSFIRHDAKPQLMTRRPQCKDSCRVDSWVRKLLHTSN